MKLGCIAESVQQVTMWSLAKAAALCIAQARGVAG
jgi:hypothetical protein